MADTTGTAAPLQDPSTTPGRSRPNNFRGGNRRGRGGARDGQQSRTQTNNQRGGREGGRGMTEVRRGLDRNQHLSQLSHSVISTGSQKPPPLGLGGGGGFGTRPTEDANNVEGEGDVKGNEPDQEDVEAEVCFICASPVVHNSVAPCNHRTCHICALRLRALYKSRACAHCRVSILLRIFASQP